MSKKIEKPELEELNDEQLDEELLDDADAEYCEEEELPRKKRHRFANALLNNDGEMVINSSAFEEEDYLKIEKSEVSIVIGARSAVFAPLNNLGIIILDEEHSENFKQDTNPRYNAIDIAKKKIASETIAELDIKKEIKDMIMEHQK